jgi:hypothetical protein
MLSSVLRLYFGEPFVGFYAPSFENGDGDRAAKTLIHEQFRSVGPGAAAAATGTARS